MPPDLIEKRDRILTWNLEGIELAPTRTCGRIKTILHHYTIEPAESRSGPGWCAPRNSYLLHFVGDPVAWLCSILGLPPLAQRAITTGPSNPPNAYRPPPGPHG